MNIKSTAIDIRNIRWGLAPAPLLPSTLRWLWQSERLPDWVCEELGLGPRGIVENLGSQVWATARSCSPRLTNYLLYLIRTRIHLIQDIKCVGLPWPTGLNPDDVAWSVRTRNCLLHQGLARNTSALASITFGELIKIPNMGVKSALDFASTLEGAIGATPNAVSVADKYESSPRESESLRAYLSEIASHSWLSQISIRDPRFRPVLPVSDKSLSEQIEDLLARDESLEDLPALQVLAGAAAQVMTITEQLEPMFLEDALSTLLETITGAAGERLQVLLDRFGWSGRKQITLEEAGQRLGVTRERIRQVQSRAENKLPDHEIYMPGLDKALMILAARAPLPVDEASELLTSAKITRGSFDVEILLRIAESFNKEVQLSIETSGNQRILVKNNVGPTVQAIARIARILAGKSGVASIFQVYEKLAASHSTLDEDSLRKTLHACQNVSFLTDDWFYVTDIKDGRNRLFNVTAKMLSVSHRLSVRSIREGAKRTFRWRTMSNKRNSDIVLPPIEVVRRYLEVHSAFRVDGDNVEATVPYDYLSELGQTERVMYEVLRESPTGVLDRGAFARGCIRRGMNENTFSIYSSYSPILDHPAPGIWILRGQVVSAAAMEAVRLATGIKPKEKRVLEYGWNEEGQLWLAIRVPFIGKNSLVVGIPGAIRRYIAGQDYEVTSKELDNAYGKIVVQEDGTSYGYGPFIMRNGIDEDDVLLAEFNIARRTVGLSIAMDEVLDD